jgi:hypothetical protein
VLICALPTAVTVFGVGLLSVIVVLPFVPLPWSSRETLLNTGSTGTGCVGVILQLMAAPRNG